MEKQIIWESKHLEIDPFNQRMIETDEDDDLGSEYIDKYDFEPPKIPTRRLGMMPFDGGVVDMDDSLNPLRQFSFWLGHTNFNISKSVAEKIIEVPGVEILRILTRYRFIMAVGKAFKPQDVKLRIQSALYDEDILDVKTKVIKNAKVKEDVKSVAKQLQELNSEWSILVFPNGNIDFAVSTPEFIDQYKDLRMQYYECQKNAGCVVISSD